MPAKKFIIPFATTGDKTSVPNSLQPDGSVSFTQGFGPDYELDKAVDPVNAKDVPRDQMNQLFFDVTDAVGEQQLYGFALWSLDRAPYPVNARVYHSDKLWRSTVINNSGEPGVTGWEDVSAQSPDFLNTARIDVASAATVDLNGLAPNTRNIRITGTTTITGFTIAVGRLYFVSFNGALTLTNNAAITTNTGGNITTFAGMTIAVRATSANVVEVLYGLRFASNAEAQSGTRPDVAVTPANLNSSVLGMGQTWQNLTGSRALATTYTNSTGRAIMVAVSISRVANHLFAFRIDGNVVYQWDDGTTASPACVTIVVPAGSTYQCTSSSGSITHWAELR